MKPWIFLAFLLGATVPSFASPLGFDEVWGYLAPGAETRAVPDAPVTDWAFFGPGLNSQGELINLPKAQAQTFPGRRHFVLAVVDNYTQVHLAVNPEYPVRARLLDALVAAAAGYDGVQIDFETVTTRDQEAFWSFLADLKARLGTKTLSVALPARTRLINDAFSYSVIEPLVDRIVVMAYDEHWSGGVAGPVASLDWGTRVATFARSRIPSPKLIMGVPLYGRAWSEKTLARAHSFSTLSPLLGKTTGVLGTGRTGGTPFLEYEETVKVKVHYDDVESQATRLGAYAAAGVKAVAFWRLGQEAPDLWPSLVTALAPTVLEPAGPAAGPVVAPDRHNSP